MSPEQVKDLTLVEVIVYISEEKSLGGGTRKVPASTRPYTKGEPKKYLDRDQHARELYEQHFGQPAPR